MSPAKENKRKNKQTGLHQTEKLLHRKEDHQQNKRQCTEWEDIFSNMCDKGLIYKISEELTKLNTKKKSN